jgi:hypothetical protein
MRLLLVTAPEPQMSKSSEEYDFTRQDSQAAAAYPDI